MTGIATFGLTHIALSVSSPERSFRFYQQLLGARLLGSHAGREDEDLSDDEFLEWGTPGAKDVITLQRATADETGDTGTLSHFGFRLVSQDDPDHLAALLEEAGGAVIDKGRFESSGEPVVYGRDPDGYEIELWFETDPAWRSSTKR